MKRLALFLFRAPVAFTFGLVLAVAILGCSTVHQEDVRSNSAGASPAPTKVPGGYLVDDAFRDRYNAMVSVYGHKKLENGAPVFTPPLERDSGVRAAGPGRWFFSDQAMEDFVVLSGLKRRGAAP